MHSTPTSPGAHARTDVSSDVGSDAGDAESDSSSLEYDHEPFSTFRSRVQELALKRVWPDAIPDDVIIERLRGGGFNRVIGLTRRFTKPHQTDGPSGSSNSSSSSSNIAIRYVLRVPRFESSRVGNDVAALHFVNRYTTIPAPKVIQFDETDQNELGLPFVILNRIPGTDLLSTYPNLTHNQRCRVARELGTVFANMLAVTSSTAGVFVLPSHNNYSKTRVKIAPLCYEDITSSSSTSLANTFTCSAATTTVFELLTSCLQAKKDALLMEYPQDTFRIKYMHHFMTMVSELHQDGWLTNHHYSLAHLDLVPRNILVNPTSQVLSPIISGILDWDSAILAPMFMSCKPPLWLWDWKDDEDEDERTANEEPPTAESRELKKSFEEAAGPDYLRFAYQPAFRLARQLVSFVINGLLSNEDFRAADAMLQEWEAVQQARRTSKASTE
ncbi:hypothetical protein F5Y10DRAFT_287670 [Nemania abortiva]|nr:hypothetical protein F5Y10DRAFT_287670 [Nemania abortiva]